jgi:hypothetical protein
MNDNIKMKKESSKNISNIQNNLLNEEWILMKLAEISNYEPNEKLNKTISLETKIKELWFVDIEEQIDLKTFYALHHLCSLNGYEVSGYVMVDEEPQKVW